jgi:hypothetical protein
MNIKFTKKNYIGDDTKNKKWSYEQYSHNKRK